MDQVLEKYGLWGLVLYTFLRDVLPAIKSAADKLIPAKIRQRERADKLKAEEIDNAADLREREVIALEQIGKMMVLSTEQQKNMQMQQQSMMNLLSAHTTSLAVLLDRVGRTAELPK